MVDARGPGERTGHDPAPGGAQGATMPIAIGAIVLLLVVAGVLAFLLWQDDEEDVFAPQQETTVGAISQDPQSFIGERVTVSGEVSEVITPFSWVLGGEQFVGGAELLVIGPPPAVGVTDVEEQEVYPQDIVQVSGEVREFNRAELEEEWGAEFPAEAFEGREGEAVLVGESVSLTPRVRDADADMVDIADILDDPGSYQGELINVSDTISEAISGSVFVLGDGLVVVDTTGMLAETALEEGVQIEATGEILDADQADVGDADLTGYEGNPVLHAEFIQILDIGD